MTGTREPEPAGLGMAGGAGNSPSSSTDHHYVDALLSVGTVASMHDLGVTVRITSDVQVVSLMGRDVPVVGSVCAVIRGLFGVVFSDLNYDVLVECLCLRCGPHRHRYLPRRQPCPVGNVCAAEPHLAQLVERVPEADLRLIAGIDRGERVGEQIHLILDLLLVRLYRQACPLAGIKPGSTDVPRMSG